MKNLVKRIFAVFISIVIVLASAPLAGFIGLELPGLSFLRAEAESATSGECGDNLTWSFDSSSGDLRIEGTGEMWDWDINYLVNAPWRSYYNKVVSVTVGSGVTSIGNDSFMHFEKLLNVYFEENSQLERIGEMAFYCCRSLAEFQIPESVVNIESFAFNGCEKITKIHIPANLKSIGQWSLNGTSLTEITVDENNKVYSNDENGVLFNKDKTLILKYPKQSTKTSFEIPDGVLYIGNNAFLNANHLESIKLPSGLICIGYSAFSGCSAIKTIDIPASVMTIEEGAFSGCSGMKNVNFEENSQLRRIGVGGFFACKSLEEIVIPPLVTKIGINAFVNCTNLKFVHIPSTVEHIGVVATDRMVCVVDGTNAYICSDKEDCYTKVYADKYSIPFKLCDEHDNSVEVLNPDIIMQGFCGDNAAWVLCSDGNLTVSGTGAIYNYNTSNSNDGFNAPWSTYRNEIKSVNVSNGITEIGSSTFEYLQQMESASIPEGVTKIAYGAFDSSIKLQRITIPASVIHIEGKAFSGCQGMTEVIWAENTQLETIGEHAFGGCTSLLNIDVPEKVKSIGFRAFRDCLNLRYINIRPENRYYSNDVNGVLFNKDKTVLIQYPLGSEITTYTIPNTVVTVGEFSFSECVNLKNVIIPESVITVEWQAFFRCEAIETVEIAKGVKSIGHNTFYNCKRLKSIVIPDSLEILGSWVFLGTTAEIRFTGSEKKWNNIQKGTNDFSNNKIIFNYGKTPINISNPNTGIVVDGLFAEDYNGSLYLEARECSKDESNIKLSGSLFNKVKLYDISIKCNGESTQPADTVRVWIPLPKNYSKKLAKIYYIDENGVKTLIPSTIEGDYIVFEIDHFSHYAVVEEFEVKIHNNQGTKTINYGETLALTATVSDKTDDITIVWYIDGVKKGEGETFNVSFESGTKTVEVKLVDENGNVLKNSSGNEIKDTETVTVKAGFFMKLISFFKNLFSISRMIVQSICL